MKKLLLWVGVCVLVSSAVGQVPPPATTPLTRNLLRTNFTTANFRDALGFLTTNNTVITNYVGNGASITNLNADELRSGTVPLARLSGITASQIANDTITTGKVDSVFYELLTNAASGGGSGDVTAAGLAAGSYAINGALATNFNYLPVYNVENFGADHNPAGTNDHWAIQQAIDFARTNSNGGIIYFPYGDYWVTNKTFHPDFASENVKSAITLWSNCVWVLEGDNATIKLQDTSASSAALGWCVIGSGNVNVGLFPTWSAADVIILRGLTFDAMNTTYLYDFTEIHNGKFFLAENCKFVNQLNVTADAIDATGLELVMARNCVFSNWNGSLFTGVNNGSGVNIFKDNYVTNCNVDYTLNHGFDIGAGTVNLLIESCYFDNVGKVMKSETGRNIFIKDSTFVFASHAALNPATNIQIQGEVTISGCRFLPRGTANTFGCILLDGNASTGHIFDNEFIGIRGVWTTNTLDLDFSRNKVVGGFPVLRFGGSGRTPYTIKDNLFGIGDSQQIPVFATDTRSDNVDFSDNTLNGHLVIAYGTNWIFANNTIIATSTGYLYDGGYGNQRFVNNRTLPYGNLANELRFAGASNYVSGNVVNDVAVYSGAYGIYFCDNIVESGVINYYSGNEASFRSANSIIQNNYNRVGVPLFSSPVYQEAVWQTTNLTTTVLDLTKGYSTITMSADVTLTAPTGVSALGKHAQTHTAIITNSSSGAKTITVPSSWFNMSTATGTIYNTNKGVLTVTVYPGAGTNYTWEGR